MTKPLEKYCVCVNREKEYVIEAPARHNARYWGAQRYKKETNSPYPVAYIYDKLTQAWAYTDKRCSAPVIKPPSILNELRKNGGEERTLEEKTLDLLDNKRTRAAVLELIKTI